MRTKVWGYSSRSAHFGTLAARILFLQELLVNNPELGAPKCDVQFPKTAADGQVARDQI